MGHSNEKCSLPGKAACTAQWHRLPGLVAWTPSVVPMHFNPLGSTLQLRPAPARGGAHQRAGAHPG